MTSGASSLGVEDGLPIPCRCLIEHVRTGLRCEQRQLVELKGGKLCYNAVFSIMFMALFRARGHRVLFRIIEAGVTEIPLSMHLEIRDIGVPVRDVAPAS